MLLNVPGIIMLGAGFTTDTQTDIVSGLGHLDSNNMFLEDRRHLIQFCFTSA